MWKGEEDSGGTEAKPSSGLAAGKRARLPLGSEIHQSRRSWLNGRRLHVEASERKTMLREMKRPRVFVCGSCVRACVRACMRVKVQDGECNVRASEEQTFACRSGNFCRTKRDCLVCFSFWRFVVELLRK